MQEILRIEDLKKYYGSKNNISKAVDGISFSVNKGEMLAIMGASGSGKTSLLNCISTIDNQSSGKIYIDGLEINKLNNREKSKFRRDKLGFVFQDFNLLDSLTSFENIALSLSIKKFDKSLIKEKIADIAKLLKIEDILNKYPHEISGGEKQRVAIARAIVTEPMLILADEPTGSLDSKSAKVLMESFSKLNSEMESTVLMVSHDPFVASYCKRIIFIKDGKIYREIFRENNERKELFKEILAVLEENHAD